jgi:hypothetical protein
MIEEYAVYGSQSRPANKLIGYRENSPTPEKEWNNAVFVVSDL